MDLNPWGNFDKNLSSDPPPDNGLGWNLSGAVLKTMPVFTTATWRSMWSFRVAPLIGMKGRVTFPVKRGCDLLGITDFLLQVAELVQRLLLGLGHFLIEQT